MSDAAKPDPTTAAPAEEKKEDKPTTTTEESKPEGEKPAPPKTTDSVFAMFGGGPKKEKKEEEESQEAKDEPSGSSKAQKEGEEVGLFLSFLLFGFGVGCLLDVDVDGLSAPESFLWLIEQSRSSLFICGGIYANIRTYRRKLPNPLKSTLSPSSASPRKSRQRPTKNSRSRPSRCALSCSDSIPTARSGRSVVPVMSDC